jgi:hypothetical protein
MTYTISGARSVATHRKIKQNLAVMFIEKRMTISICVTIVALALLFSTFLKDLMKILQKNTH